MNSSKKIMNKQNEAEQKGKSTIKMPSAKKPGKLGGGGVQINTKKLVLAVICIAIVLVLCIGVGIQQLKPKVVLTINKTKITMNQMMYPIYERESKYLPYDEMYQYYTGSSVWDNQYSGTDANVSSGTTMADGLKQEIIDTETEYVILYDEAVKAGYSLTADEKKDAATKAEEALKGLSFSQKLQLNISKSNLTKRFLKRDLADKYKDATQEDLNKDVDEEAAKKTVSKTDYREYDVQYYTVATTSTDSDGNTSKLSAAKKKKLLAKLQAVYDKAKTAKDFTKLVDSDKEKDVTYSSDKFTEKDGWSKVTTKSILKKIKALDNDEISPIYEDESTGCYIFVKMTNNNSTASYKTACETAVTSAQTDAFDTWYKNVCKNYTVKENTDLWDSITIGTVTTSIVTADDLEAMSKSDSSSSGASSTK